MGTLAETASVDYRLSFADQENKLPLSVSVCSEQTEVCRFHFRLQKTIESSRFQLVSFSISSVFRLRKHEDIHYMET
jgi:hypothetical protein